MEITILNKSNEKHYITIENSTDNITITVIKLRTLGGIPGKVVLELDYDIGFSKAMTKINNIVHLDDEIYNMLSEHQKE